MAAANARLPECVSVLLKHGAKASRRDRRRQDNPRACSDRFSRLAGKSMTEVELILTLLASAEDHEQAGELPKGCRPGGCREQPQAGGAAEEQQQEAEDAPAHVKKNVVTHVKTRACAFAPSGTQPQTRSEQQSL